MRSLSWLSTFCFPSFHQIVIFLKQNRKHVIRSTPKITLEISLNISYIPRISRNRVCVCIQRYRHWKKWRFIGTRAVPWRESRLTWTVWWTWMWSRMASVLWLDWKNKNLFPSFYNWKKLKTDEFLVAQNQTYVYTYHFNWVVSLHARSLLLPLPSSQQDSSCTSMFFFSISILNALRQLMNVECNSTQIRHTKIEPWNQN